MDPDLHRNDNKNHTTSVIPGLTRDLKKRKHKKKHSGGGKNSAVSVVKKKKIALSRFHAGEGRN
jgi:hypothetical protein